MTQFPNPKGQMIANMKPLMQLAAVDGISERDRIKVKRELKALLRAVDRISGPKLTPEEKLILDLARGCVGGA